MPRAALEWARNNKNRDLFFAESPVRKMEDQL